MAWVTPTVLAVSALAGLGSAGLSSASSNSQAKRNEALQYQALAEQRQNATNQAMVQALINQRSIAGQTDAFGSSVQYDPATNTWKSTLGKLPMDAQTAAQQAAISRNTTDLRAGQFANEQAALRATRAGPAADAAQRQLANFRPMSGGDLAGLLQKQATDAQQMTFRPMIADTLRQFARTGTAAGPVLGQIGRSQEQGLRDSLIDAQIKGMTGAADINNSRLQGLQTNATTTANLANPTLQFGGLAGSGGDNTMNQVISQRAAQAGVAPAQGMYGANMANAAAAGAYGTAGKNIADPNFGLNSAVGGLNQMQTAFGPGGAANALIKSLTNNNQGNYTGPSAFQLGTSDTSDPASLQKALGLSSDQYVP